LIFAQCVGPEANAKFSDEAINAAEELPAEIMAQVTKEPEPESAEIPTAVSDVLPKDTMNTSEPLADAVPDTAVTADEATAPEMATRAGEGVVDATEDGDAAKDVTLGAEVTEGVAEKMASGALGAQEVESDAGEAGVENAADAAAVPSKLPEEHREAVVGATEEDEEVTVPSPEQEAVVPDSQPENEEAARAPAQTTEEKQIEQPGLEPAVEEVAIQAPEEEENAPEQAPIDVGTPVAMTINGQPAVDNNGVARKSAWQVGTVTEVKRIYACHNLSLSSFFL